MPVLSEIALVWSALPLAAALWATILVRRRPPAAADPPTTTPVLLVRPCAGNEPRLVDALASTALAARGRSMSVRFAIASDDDAALPAVTAACASLTGEGVDARVVVTGASGPNRKADQIARVVDAEAFPIVIVADSDVELATACIDALLGPLNDDARVGATWAPPIEVHPTTTADCASAAVLDASLHAFSLLSALDPGCMVGKLCAFRSEALAAVGGMSALVDALGEDMEVSRRLRAKGLRVVRVPAVARSLACGRTAGAAIGRYARWISVIRAQRPALLVTYPLLFAAFPFALAIAIAAAWREGTIGAVAVVGVVTARVLTAFLARVASARPFGIASLAVEVLLADLVLAAAFVRALTSSRTNWRGRSVRLAGGGRIVDEAS